MPFFTEYFISTLKVAYDQHLFSFLSLTMAQEENQMWEKLGKNGRDIPVHVSCEDTSLEPAWQIKLNILYGENMLL